MSYWIPSTACPFWISWGPATKTWFSGPRKPETSEINISRTVYTWHWGKPATRFVKSWICYNGHLILLELYPWLWSERRSWWRSTPLTIRNLTLWFSSRKTKRMRRRFALQKWLTQLSSRGAKCSQAANDPNRIILGDKCPRAKNKSILSRHKTLSDCKIS